MSTVASDIALCYIVPMIKEKPKPLLVRFYKNERRAIKRYSKIINASEAEVVRRMVRSRFLYDDGTIREAEMI